MFSDQEAINDLPFADIYGISITSLEISKANRFSSLIKRKFPRSVVGVGGPGAYFDGFIDTKIIDFICKGEAENIIRKIIEDYKNERLKKIYHGKQSQDLDSLPFPARHLLGDKQGGNIFAYNKKYKSEQSTVLLTSRGCPFNCSFCSSPFLFSRKVRFRSPENIYKEIKFVIETLKIKEFRISDDTFILDPKRLLEITKYISKLDIVWRISTRTKPFTKENAKILYESGCKEISFGVESFDNNVLKMLNKETTVKDNIRAIEIAMNQGINTRILLMIRTPGQTKQTIFLNIKHLTNLQYTIVSCTNFVPLPGTDVWNNPEKYNIKILNKNLDDYNLCLFGNQGLNKWKNIFKIRDRSLEEFNEESDLFIDFLKNTKKLNMG